MDSTDDVADVIDPESEIFRSTDVRNNPSSSKPNDKNEGSLKRKCEDDSEGNRPKKIRCIDDSALFTHLNTTENDPDLTWYSFADGEEDNLKENSCLDSANEIHSDLFQFATENVNEDIKCSIINDSTTSKDAEDGNGAAILARSEQKEYLADNDILEEINTEDNQTQDSFQTPCISNTSMKNKIADEINAFCEITVADDTNTLPKISCITPEKDGFITSTNNMSISINDVEKNCSLVFTEVNMDSPLSEKNEECCVSDDHQELKNTQEITDICSGFALFEASSPTTRCMYDESPTKWYECAPIRETEFEKVNIDQKFLDYISTNVEPLAGKNKIANQDKMAEIEEQASNSSACDMIFRPLSDCSDDKFPSISYMGTLAHQESQNSDFVFGFGAIGDCDSSIITPEMKLQNDPQQIIEPSKGGLVFKNNEQPNDNHFDAAYEMDYMNINVEHVAGENKVSNKNEVTEDEEKISNSSRCETMLISSGDFSCAKISSNTDALAQQELKNNLIPEQKSTQATELQNAPVQITEANEEFSLISKNQESQNSDFVPDFGAIGDCDSPIIMREMKLQNDPQQIIKPNKGGSVFKNNEQPNDNHFDAAYEMDYMDINVEPVTGENKDSNKNEVTEDEEQISNSSGCEAMWMSFGDFSSAKIPSNTNASEQQKLKNNFTSEQKSTEATELHNAPDQITEANEEFSLVSKNKEPKDKLPSKIKKKKIQRDEALEQERGIILDLMKEYVKSTKLEEFTSLDIVDFITKRMPNATYFKVLHTVRIFIVNSVKSGVLKKSGQNYTLGCRASDTSVANISEKV